MPSFLIGIDPDVEANGLAVWDIGSKQFTTLTTLPFYPLLRVLEKLDSQHTVKVVLEAGWLIKTANWHRAGNKAIAARIGLNVGRNHQVGRLIQEYLVEKDIPFKLVKPKGKLNAIAFKRITGWEGVTNSEVRDAGMLVYQRG